MAFLPLKTVIGNIKKRERTVAGQTYAVYDAYLGVDPKDRKPVRMAMASKAKLEEAVRARYKGLQGLRGSETMLTPEQIKDAAQALLTLADANVHISLTECARLAIASPILGEKYQSAVSTCTVAEAFKAYLKAKETKSANTQKTIVSKVGQFVTKFGPERPLSDVTAPLVKQYLAENYYDPDDVKTWTTYNKTLGELTTFMNWCTKVEQKYLRANPLEGMEKIQIGYRQPEYMKAADVEKLFRRMEARVANPQRRADLLADADLADAILSFFCGMRQEEIERVREGEEAVAINLEERFIIVKKCKGSTRGVKPRTFQIPEQAMAWIKTFDFMSAVMKRNRFRRHLKRMAKEADFNLTENAGRHTFITMYTAAFHDERALTAIVGNSEDVRTKNYNGIEVEKEGKAYFAILPSPCCPNE